MELVKRSTYDDRWTYVEDDEGNGYWIDWESERAYHHDGSLPGVYLNDALGDRCIELELQVFD